jgi:hypothetical protein
LTKETRDLKERGVSVWSKQEERVVEMKMKRGPKERI